MVRRGPQVVCTPALHRLTPDYPADTAVEITAAEGKLLRARASDVEASVAVVMRAVGDLIEHVTQAFPVEDRDGTSAQLLSRASIA